MTAAPRAPWLRAALVAAVLYVAIGLGTAALARVATGEGRTAWRLAAWGLGAVVFAAHLWRERPAASAVRGAWHACVAVALGTCPIAAAAVVHNLARAPLRAGMVLAFVVWPVLTGVASFAAGLAVLATWRAFVRPPVS